MKEEKILGRPPKKNKADVKSERFTVTLTPNEVEKIGGRDKVYNVLQCSILKCFV